MNHGMNRCMQHGKELRLPESLQSKSNLPNFGGLQLRESHLTEYVGRITRHYQTPYYKDTEDDVRQITVR